LAVNVADTAPKTDRCNLAAVELENSGSGPRSALSLAGM
jgi:hypothetical protein